MRNLSLRKVLIGLTAFIGLSSAAFALTIPPSFAPRQVPYQTTTHIRKTINWNDANIAAGVKVAAIPAGAYVTSLSCYVTTAFNAGTTNSLKIGTTQTGADLVAGGTTAGTNCVLGSTGNNNMTAAPGLGLAVTGGASPTGATGGWDVWMQYAQTGTAATAGQVTVVIEYTANDDQ